MYKLVKNPMTNEIINFILRIEDNANIPMDEANTDYQAYLKWLDEGNTPESAEE